jgi:hypothetical protein
LEIIRSEVDDVNLGLEHYYGDFNVVHARAVASGVCGLSLAHERTLTIRTQIKDYPGFIDHVCRVLRPGGLMYLAEFDFNMYDEDKNMVHVDTSAMGPPWVACWIKFFMKAVEKRGGTSQVPAQLFDWVRQRPELEDVTFRQVWLPASPFRKGDDPESVLLRRVGEQAREDVLVRMPLLHVFPTHESTCVAGNYQVGSTLATWPRSASGRAEGVGGKCTKGTRGS